jgi:hypothetical protein
MVEPVILSDEIINQARLWRDECSLRWDRADVLPRIGEATLTSSVDGSRRNVVLHLVPVLDGDVKAKTWVSAREVDGSKAEAYTIALNTSMIAHPFEDHLPILLRELTHVVDPEFDKDFHRQNPSGAPAIVLTRRQRYQLPSERRAFTAMWTADLIQDIRSGKHHDLEEASNRYCGKSAEFYAFVVHTPDLADERLEHFRRMVEELRRRMS